MSYFQEDVSMDENEVAGEKEANIEKELDAIDFSDEEEDIKYITEAKLIKLTCELNRMTTGPDDEPILESYQGTKHEILKSDFKIHPIELTAENTLIAAGSLIAIESDSLALVEAIPECGTLDLDNVLFSQGKAVGFIEDVFGQVDAPIYSLATYFDLREFISEGAVLSVALEHAKFVELQELKKNKGTDASNAYDEETQNNEFSDDEEEQQRKKKKVKMSDVEMIGLALDAQKPQTFNMYVNPFMPPKQN